MNRMDYYDILPKGMDAYLSSHGHHFSKPMLEWAVSMMKGRDGSTVQVIPKSTMDEILKSHNIKLTSDAGYYDPIYVWCMAKSDYYGSSITDEQHLAKYVKDYIDDPDGNETRAFDEFITNCTAKGVDIPWEDII